MCMAATHKQMWSIAPLPEFTHSNFFLVASFFHLTKGLYFFQLTQTLKYLYLAIFCHRPCSSAWHCRNCSILFCSLLTSSSFARILSLNDVTCNISFFHCPCPALLLSTVQPESGWGHSSLTAQLPEQGAAVSYDNTEYCTFGRICLEDTCACTQGHASACDFGNLEALSTLSLS